MLFHKLTVVVTGRCNAECDFCCFSCSPPRSTRVLAFNDTEFMALIADEVHGRAERLRRETGGV